MVDHANVSFPSPSKSTVSLGISTNDVKKLDDPDPDFPSVSFPNPEEPGALSQAFGVANTVNPSLVLAADPDAVRFSVAVRFNDGVWQQFTADKLGILIASYLFASEQTA